MRIVRVFRVAAPLLACVAMCLPPALQAAPAARGPVVADVVLHEGDLVAGQLVNEQGVALAAQKVEVRRDGKIVTVARTTDQGIFAARGLSSGVYELSAPGAARVVRVWPANVAPPTANQAVLLVSEGEVVRGQQRFGTTTGVIIAGAVVAGAVAIPIAVANSNNDAS